MSQLATEIFVDKRMREQTKHLQTIINRFQMDLMGMQHDFNKKWNALNAIVRTLYKKGLITNEALTEAGQELMAEAKKNMEYMVETKKNNKIYDPDKIIKSALDEAVGVVMPTPKKDENES